MDRRKFLESMALLGAASTMPLSFDKLGAMPRTQAWNGTFDENLVCIISDLHTCPGSYQPDKLRRTIADILAMNPRPRNLISLGDNAYLTGKDEEYALLKEILAPLEGSGIVFTMAHGNHDRRENFVKFFPEQVRASVMENRLVQVVETPRADLIVLDTLDEPEDTTTWITPGAIDDDQKAWLEWKLNSETDKPFFVMSHHPLDEVKISSILVNSPTCCGYIHGHDHVWRPDWIKKSYGDRRIVRTLCVPSTGHWGDLGYTLLNLQEDRGVATLHEYEYFFPSPAKPDEPKPAAWAAIEEDHKGATCTFIYNK